MKKQPELTAQTRKKLIDTYFELTAKEEKATVGAIAEAAGYNRNVTKLRKAGSRRNAGPSFFVNI